ncbi:hypothetical protein AGMMS50268_29720 [Spirochaetia bacterium]|nr:hypothetical protein AGMMS50268_29720 [Spirochaetia bacterium]
METISVVDIRNRNIEIINYRIGKNNVIVTEKKGEKYLLENVQVNKKGSHTVLMQDGNKIIISNNNVIENKSINIGIIGIVVLIIFLIIFSVNKKPNASIQERINELNQIQKTLTVLNDYVVEQQNNLLTLKNTITMLENKRQTHEKILSLENEQIEALFQYQNREQTRNKWIERGFSVLIGLFTGLIVAGLSQIFIKKKQERNDP